MDGTGDRPYHPRAVLRELADIVDELLRALLECRIGWNEYISRIEAAGDLILDRKPELLAVARRRYAYLSLQAVLDFLHALQARELFTHSHLALDAHLLELAGVLLDLNHGRVPDMLMPSSRPSERVAPSEIILRTHAVVAVELLNKAGHSLKEARKIIAERLQGIGYRTPRGRKSEIGSGEITANTLNEWRKEAREAPGKSMLGYCYQLLSDMHLAPTGTAEDFRGRANQICNYFLLYAPDVRAKRLPAGLDDP
jgi:hypothetical protein